VRVRLKGLSVGIVLSLRLVITSAHGLLPNPAQVPYFQDCTLSFRNFTLMLRIPKNPTVLILLKSQNSNSLRIFILINHIQFQIFDRCFNFLLSLETGDTVFCGGAASTPIHVLEALTNHGKANNLRDITVVHMHTEGPALYAQPDCKDIFRSKSTFMGANVRKAVAEGKVEVFSKLLSLIFCLFLRSR
jgi:hypothetical protein